MNRSKELFFSLKDEPPLLRYRFQALKAFRTQRISGADACPSKISLRHFKSIAHRIGAGGDIQAEWLHIVYFADTASRIDKGDRERVRRVFHPKS